MSLADRITELTEPTATPYVPHRASRVAHPQGWEPGVRYEPSGAMTVTTPATEPLGAAAGPEEWAAQVEALGLHVPAGWRVRLVEAKYDPAAWHRDQQGEDAVTRPIWRYRFAVEPSAAATATVDVGELVAEIKRHRPSRRPAATVAGEALVVALADWQIAKPDGDGLRGTVARVLALGDQVEAHAWTLRRAGRRLDALYVLCLGDLVEGCFGHYEMQAFGVQLDRRDQVKVARRLLVGLLTRWARLFDRVVVAAVAGNHGENRRKDKAYTTFGDNDDVALVEQAAEVLAANPRAYGHVSFVIPREDLSVTVEAAGLVLGITHGHVAGPGATAEAKLQRWWERQAAGKRPIGDADVLVSGHYHHFRAADWGACTWLQAPTMDGGSRWYEETYGVVSRPGSLTFTVSPSGVDDIKVLGGAA